MIAVAMHCVMCNSILQTSPPAPWPGYYPLLHCFQESYLLIISLLSRLELPKKLRESFYNVRRKF